MQKRFRWLRRSRLVLPFQLILRKTAERSSGKKDCRHRVRKIVADNRNKADWSLGCISTINSNGRTIWIADAHRGDGKRFVVRADEKLTAFLELESASVLAANCLDKLVRFFQNSGSLNGFESGGGHFPARFFAPSGPAIAESTQRGKRKEQK